MSAQKDMMNVTTFVSTQLEVSHATAQDLATDSKVMT